jgi:hypothetical protein
LIRKKKTKKRVTIEKKGHWHDYHLPFFSEEMAQRVFKAIPRHSREKVRYDHWRIADTWVDEMNMIVRDEYGEESI